MLFYIICVYYSCSFGFKIAMYVICLIVIVIFCHKFTFCGEIIGSLGGSYHRVLCAMCACYSKIQQMKISLTAQ